MIDDPDRHIPDNIRDAFADAVPLLIHWDRGGPEPFVSLGGEPAHDRREGERARHAPGVLCLRREALPRPALRLFVFALPPQ